MLTAHNKLATIHERTNTHEQRRTTPDPGLVATRPLVVDKCLSTATSDLDKISTRIILPPLSFSHPTWVPNRINGESTTSVSGSGQGGPWLHHVCPKGVLALQTLSKLLEKQTIFQNRGSSALARDIIWGAKKQQNRRCPTPNHLPNSSSNSTTSETHQA